MIGQEPLVEFELSSKFPEGANKYTTFSSGSSHKITWIKAYRTITGAGLKEAKQLIELAQERGTVQHTLPKSVVDQLVDAGFGVSIINKEQPTVDNVAQCAKDAIDDGDYQFASDLLELVLRYQQ